MAFVVALVLAVILGVSTVLLAFSHNRPFDALSERSKGRWLSLIP
jgi:hypothetical protein